VIGHISLMASKSGTFKNTYLVFRYFLTRLYLEGGSLLYYNLYKIK
jgi:hypothetical protein